MVVKKQSFSIPRLGFFTDNNSIDIIIGIIGLIFAGYLGYLYFFSGQITNIWYSHRTGKYNAPIQLYLVKNVMNSELRYTLDGKEPTKDSALYDNNAILLTASAAVKTRLFKGETPIGTPTTETILIDEHTDLAVISLTTDDANLWDETIGMYTSRNDTLHTLSEEEREKERLEDEDDGGEYNQEETEEEAREAIQRDIDWNRPGNIQFFEAGSGVPAFKKNINFRIYGGKTRNSAQKSLKICTSQNDSIHYPIFENYDLSKFKCLVLRNSGGDWRLTMIRDALMQSIIRDNSNVTTQNYRPAIVYLNGRYWGIHNITEYYNDNDLANKYGGERRDYAILFPNREDKVKKGGVEIEAGNQKDAEDYYRLRDQLMDLDMKNPLVVSWVEELMDINDYFEYTIFETYFGNDDWIENNIKVWRYMGIDRHETDAYGRDGKFRWLVYDLDNGMGTTTETPPYDKNILKNLLQERDDQNRTWPYALLRNLLKSDTLRNQYINTYADHLNTTFLPEKIIPKINAFEDGIKNEMPKHIEKWRNSRDAWSRRYIQSMDEWHANIQKLRDFTYERPNHVYEQIKLQFNLTFTFKVRIYELKTEEGTVRINSLNINSTEWEGTYFSEIPIEIEAIPNRGYHFKNWEGYSTTSNSLLKIVNTVDISLKPIFEKD
jgi:hypothetical protein